MDTGRQDRYHDLGAAYFWFAGKRRLAIDLLRRCTHPSEIAIDNRRTLDVGCGPGHDVDDFRPFGSLYGLDPSLTALMWCRRQHPSDLRLVCATGERLPFQASSFDLVIMLDVLEHVDADTDCLRDCRRILKTGGQLVLTVPAFQWLWGSHDTWYGHKRRYTVPEIQQKLAQAGFLVERATYIEWLFVLPLWIVRRAKQWIPRLSHQDDFVRVPPWLNTLLTHFIALEVVWLRHHSLPWGVSIICIARASAT